MRPEIRGVINVGGNTENYKISWVGDIVQEVVPGVAVETLARDDDRSYKVNFDKIRQLGFVPLLTVKEGVREVVQAFETGRLCNYKNPLYSNCRSATWKTLEERSSTSTSTTASSRGGSTSQRATR
jgi:hypothetical protein